MENLHFGKEQLAKGIYATPLPPTRQLAQVAVADIGAIAVRLLEDPGRFAGKRFDLGSDELTGNDVVAILSRVTGHPFTYFQVPLDVIRQRMGEDGAKMYEWLDGGRDAQCCRRSNNHVRSLQFGQHFRSHTGCATLFVS
jgi:uncharacterized protein YbjT (DUF2867 family)